MVFENPDDLFSSSIAETYWSCSYGLGAVPCGATCCTNTEQKRVHTKEFTIKTLPSLLLTQEPGAFFLPPLFYGAQLVYPHCFSFAFYTVTSEAQYKAICDDHMDKQSTSYRRITKASKSSTIRGRG